MGKSCNFLSEVVICNNTENTVSNQSGSFTQILPFKSDLGGEYSDSVNV